MTEIKCNELPQEAVLTNTLKLVGNSDDKIKQIGVELLKEYITNNLQGQIEIIQNYIGDLNDLSTTQKDTLVNAVKEVDDKITGLNTDISNIQTDVTELNSALNGVRLQRYSFTTPSTISTWTDVVNVAGLGIVLGAITEVSIDNASYLNSPEVKLRTYGSDISVVTDNQAYTNRPATMIVFYR